MGVLAVEIQNIDPQFAFLVDSADGLSPFATVYRYPGEQEVPTREEFEGALNVAQKILFYVSSKINA